MIHLLLVEMQEWELVEFDSGYGDERMHLE
jgi:hypothetical protein